MPLPVALRSVRNRGRAAVVAAIVLAGHGGSAAAAGGAPVDGLWDATVQVKGVAIPFRLRLSGPPQAVKATFFDGERPVSATTAGRLDGDQLHLAFASYASRLDAQFAHDALTGTLGGLPFRAERHRPAKSAPGAPSIAGDWVIPIDTPKGEKAWRLIVRQTPTATYAAILRIDGDTGTISGLYDGRVFRLSRYAGERPTSLVVKPRADGALDLALDDVSGHRELTALRPAAARKAGLAAPSDPATHTGVRDREERFHFSGVDAGGRTVTDQDPRFRGKVVLVNVWGSWCPNCHDEAPFLAELDARYRTRGLRIVGLDFETPDELATHARLKAFVERYRLRYTILVGGERSEVNQRLPQATNLNAWPTTFFLGRDGRVKAVHVGFPSRGSGTFDQAARAQISRQIEALLAEPS